MQKSKMEKSDDDTGKRRLCGRAKANDMSEIILSDEEVIRGFLTAHLLVPSVSAGEDCDLEMLSIENRCRHESWLHKECFPF